MGKRLLQRQVIIMSRKINTWTKEEIDDIVDLIMNEDKYIKDLDNLNGGVFE